MKKQLLLATLLSATLVGCVSTDSSSSSTSSSADSSPLTGLWGIRADNEQLVKVSLTQYRPDHTGTQLSFMQHKQQGGCLKILAEFTWKYDADSKDYQQVDKKVSVEETAKETKYPEGATISGKVTIQEKEGKTFMEITTQDGKKMGQIKAPDDKLFKFLMAKGVETCKAKQ